MTRQEFNEKYKQWIPEGWSGLDFDKPQVTEYLDREMQDLVMIPGFELHQIKMKFEWPRVYFTTSFKNKATELAIAMRIQEDINRLMKGQSTETKWKRAAQEERYKLDSRMDVIGQNGNEGTHYNEENWMDEQYRDEYHRTVASGMFFEWYPNLTGQWQKDKQAFVQEMKQIEERKSKQTD